MAAGGATSSRIRPLAQILICEGCCCGRVDRGFPPVPRQWLKSEWKNAKLNRSVQLTMSGCLGPCDVANVVAILRPDGCTWLAGLTQPDEYGELLEWAKQVAARSALLPLPAELQQQAFERF